MRDRVIVVTAAIGLLGVAACGDNQEPGDADELWTRIHAEDYRSWARAPGYATRRQSNAAHGDMVDIFVNGVVASALDAKAPLSAWPDGSIVAKDGYDGGELDLVAVMEKRSGSWFWAEYDAAGSASYSGSPSICIDCHRSGSDYVRAFALRR